MKQYRIDTHNWTSKEYTNYEEAQQVFEETKDSVMANGVDYDSYVELIVSEDDFDSEQTLIRVQVVVDEQKHKELGEPRDNGCDFDYWAKWEVFR